MSWAVRNRWIVSVGCAAFFGLSILCAKTIGTEFFPSQDNSRISVKLQLPIGTRVEIAEDLAKKLTNQWLTRYGENMPACNFTVGQADTDNTFASMQANGSQNGRASGRERG